MYNVVLFCSIMMLWNRKYQEFDLVVSSVTTKVKGVAQIHLHGIGDVVWDVVDYSGSSQVGAGAFGHWVFRKVDNLYPYIFSSFSE